jgi:type I restriction enzyme S subunit
LKSFPTKQLAQIAELVGGGTPSRNEPKFWGGDIPWLTPTSMSPPKTTIDALDGVGLECITTEGLQCSSARMIPTGSVIYSTRATIGKVGINTIPISTNQGFTSFIPDRNQINSRFLGWVLIWATPQIEALCGNTTFKEVSKGNIRQLEIPLPPVPEQHRIVEILDQADALRRQRGEADDVSKRILPALFQEMFGSDDFPRIPLSEILISIKGGWSPVCENRSVEDGEWGVLKLGAATYCEYRPHENKALRSDCEPRKELEVRKGDLLFTRKNTRELVGAAAYVFETPSRLMTPDLIFRLIPNPEIIDPIYLWQAMIQPEARMMIQAQASGAAASMVNISQNRLMPLEFPVPPISAQRRFADAVQTYRNSAKQQSTSAATLETLFQTLLHRAFDGSLTAAWREGQAKELLQEMEHQIKA